MIIVYRARTVGPICRKLASLSESISAAHERELVSPVKEVLVRWGSMWLGEAEFEINGADAVALSRNKRESRRELGALGPGTWFTRDDLEVPCVIRPKRHHAGRKFFVCHEYADVDRAIRSCRHGWYASELVDKVREYRVFVLQGRAVCVSERFPNVDGDVAWNLANGGRLTNVRYGEWPVPVILMAIDAMEKLDLDWGAVDLAVRRDGGLVVFEVNTAPGLKNPFTLRRVAKAFTWVGENPEVAPEEITQKRVTWRELLHPALGGR